MRVLAVTPYYSPEGGGLERYAHMVLSRLASRGHEVHALATTNGHGHTTTMDGVHLTRVPATITVGNTPLDPGFRKKVAATIDETRPDVVVAHTPVPYAAEMAWLAARRKGIPFVTTYHGGRLRGSSRLLDGIAALDRATFERSMLAGSRALIAVSPYVRDNALGRHSDRVTIIPPGVDATRFYPGERPQAPNILFVGPLAEAYRWKGIDVLWQAFLLVQQRIPEVRLTIVGDGDRKAEFAAKAGGSGGPVRLLGRLTDGSLATEYRHASMLVLPSLTEAESFGMVLAEANACGRPVVASSVGGIPSFVREGENGLLARPGDVQHLAARILELLQDPDRADAMGQRGRERVQREHDWDRITEATEKVLEAAAYETLLATS